MSDEPDAADDQDGEEGDLPLATATPTVDAASLQTVKGRNRALLEARAKKITFMRAVLADPLGRDFFWDLLNNQCHLFEDRFACGPNGFPQEQATWFHAGEKAVGDRLYRTLLRIDLEGVAQMHREHDTQFSEPKTARRKSQS